MTASSIDLCDISLDEVSFDPQTGEYSFSSSSMNDFPPGDYVIRVTGDVVEGEPERVQAFGAGN